MYFKKESHLACATDYFVSQARPLCGSLRFGVFSFGVYKEPEVS